MVAVLSALSVLASSGDSGGLGIGATIGLFVGIPAGVVGAVIAAVYLGSWWHARRSGVPSERGRSLPVLGTLRLPEEPDPSGVARRSRARSFGLVAEEYDQTRPAPPLLALHWALPQRCELALDLAAGTGIATRVLARRARHVVAVEPDARMNRLLHERSPQITTITATAEALPIRDARLDAVLVCSAWHWFTQPNAGQEISRVLRPGGVLAVLYCGLDEPAQRWLSGLATMRHGADTAPGARRRQPPRLPPGLPFAEWQQATFHWNRQMRADELATWVCTHSPVLTAGPTEKTRTETRALEYIRAHSEPGQDGRIEVPFRVTCWRAYRDPTPLRNSR
ncbi:class I SAM-dependent methyltransferase [Sciscionella marina]|uniref:class I SAM-dependent methyltransferase n=1 Tax=Sciscionella marina TaxID=508770 RepID=UPI0012F67001|nr:class I SAM-dependent methyltransferase [Sciscionella marina]